MPYATSHGWVGTGSRPLRGTLTELVALAQNSPPTQALRGRSADIARMNTFQEIIRLRTLTTSEGLESKRVVLLFDEAIGTTGNSLEEEEAAYEGAQESAVTTMKLSLLGNDLGSTSPAPYRTSQQSPLDQGNSLLRNRAKITEVPAPSHK